MMRGRSLSVAFSCNCQEMMYIFCRGPDSPVWPCSVPSSPGRGETLAQSFGRGSRECTEYDRVASSLAHLSRRGRHGSGRFAVSREKVRPLDEQPEDVALFPATHSHHVSFQGNPAPERERPPGESGRTSMSALRRCRFLQCDPASAMSRNARSLSNDEPSAIVGRSALPPIICGRTVGAARVVLPRRPMKEGE